MIKLNIAKGFLIISDENNQIYPGWLGDTTPDYPGLPEPAEVYRKCVDRGLSQERTIDVMLKIFHRQRFIRGGFLSDFDLIIGLVGPRGSGKSCGGSAIAIWDYLLCGIPVFSNMDIKVVVRYKKASKVFESANLDKTSLLDVRDQEQMYRNCLIFVDEANIEMAESQRTMGNRSLWFSYALQQARKRHLSMIHTEQSEYHVTERLRWQTSLYISTKDAAYQYGTPKPGSMGRKSLWKVHDYSGIITGEAYEGTPVFDGVFHNTPFWHSFDTEQIQSGETELPDHKKQKTDISITPGTELAALKEEYADALTIIGAYSKKGEETRVWCDKLWENLDISGDRGEQVRIGGQLKALGVKSGQSTGGRRFYRIPQKSDFSDNGG